MATTNASLLGRSAISASQLALSSSSSLSNAGECSSSSSNVFQDAINSTNTQQLKQSQSQLYANNKKLAKKAARSKRCKSLLMLSSPFSASATATMKSSLLSLLNPIQHNNHTHQDADLSYSTDQLVTLTGSSNLPESTAANQSQEQAPVPAPGGQQNQQQQQLSQQQRSAKCVKMKLFEQPLDKLFSPKAMKQLNNAIGLATCSPNDLFDSSAAKRKRSSTGSPAAATATSLRKFSSLEENSSPKSNNNHIININNGADNGFKTGGNNGACYDHSTDAVDGGKQILSGIDERRRLLLAVLPEPIKNLLIELYLRGPSTVGIFRKSPNAKHCKELRQKLEADSQSSVEEFQVNVIASVFKEWLRSLPDCLLMSRLYPQWIDAAKLIEPLHHYNQQRCGQSQSLDDSYSDNTMMNSTTTTSTSLRPSTTQPSSSPLTDNGRADVTKTTATNNHYLYRHEMGSHGPLDRARSCSTTISSSTTSSVPIKNNGITSRDTPSGPSMVSGYLSGAGSQENGQRFKLLLSNGGLSQSELLNSHQSLSMSEFALMERHSECLRIVRQLLDALNETNLILLRSFICVLWHISNNCDANKMSSNNLGVCVGQSLLNDENQTAIHGNKFTSSTFTKRHRRTRSQCILSSTLSLTGANSTAALQNAGYLDSSGAQETAKYVPMLVAFLIDNAPALFGENVLSLFDTDETEQRKAQLAASSMEAEATHPKSLSPSASTTTSSSSASNDNNNNNNASGNKTDIKPNGELENRAEQRQSANSQSFDAIDHRNQLQQQQLKNPSRMAPRSSTSSLCSSDPETPIKCIDGLNRRQQHQIVVLDNNFHHHHHIACEQEHYYDNDHRSRNNRSNDSDCNLSASSSGCLADDSSATTSILIVNEKRPKSSKAQNQQQKQPPLSNCAISASGTNITESAGQTSLLIGDNHHHGSNTSQSRPLSATESTTSSSRASSSTSGVHSESPAFSNETDNMHHDNHQASTTASTSPAPSTLSSPASVSAPTSPVQGSQEMAHHERALYSSSPPPRSNDKETQLPTDGKTTALPADAIIRYGDSAIGTMYGAGNSDTTGTNRQQSYAHNYRMEDSQAHYNQQRATMPTRHQSDASTTRLRVVALDRVYSQRQHHEGSDVETNHRHSAALGNSNRVPKIPVQFTTSSYGGEAVIYNPRPRHSLPGGAVAPMISMDQQQQQKHDIESENQQRELREQRLNDFLAHQQRQRFRQHLGQSAPSIPTNLSLASQPVASYCMPSRHQSIVEAHQQPQQRGQLLNNYAIDSNMIGYAQRAQQHHQLQQIQQQRNIFYSTSSSTNLSSLQTDQFMKCRQHQNNCGCNALASKQPQRSHVMLLRDYYLSLQHEQMIQQQRLYAYRDRIYHQAHRHNNTTQRHQQPQLQRPLPVNNSHEATNKFQHTSQPGARQLAMHNHNQHQTAGSMDADGGGLRSISILAAQQQQQQNGATSASLGDTKAAVTATTNPASLTSHQAVQRPQPRLAKIRQNQFNTIYVKHQQHNSPSSLLPSGVALQKGAVSNGAGGKNTSLLVKPPTSGTDNSTDNSSDELSDDLSSEWMESTMV